MTYTLIHLTDVHVVPEGPLHGSADPVGGLRAALSAVRASGLDVAAIVLSGDLADQGDLASYRILEDAVGEAARALGAVVVTAMGNHDERAAFRAGLSGLNAAARPRTGEGAWDAVTMAGGLRLIALDTSVPGHHHGELDDDQLAWLADTLAEPAPDGSVLVLHHPRIPSVLPLMNGIGLREPARLARVLEGSDVRLVLAGHTHSASAGTLAGIPIWVGPGSAYAADTMAPAGRTRALASQAFTRVDLGPSGVLTTLVPLSPAPPVYELDTEVLLSHIG
ncbi:metallophosphatase [Nonomuraea sp. WAC 01424]|uniref:metallophosphoesterase n=1 Tax=Nonomuraea sp. WAC 01424 TaxID=2203200 RepID=UPI000F778238|nr:metallophosphoesterase [Nonomuraea sp. WAC 01424]RSN12936.1 metallophosphatase [Nonomuraea sp. WAC 01424]